MFSLGKIYGMPLPPCDADGKSGGNSRNGDDRPVHPLHMPHGIQLFEYELPSLYLQVRVVFR
ncbi:hypothetical protein ES708_30752 [subsurface metagenome]